MVERNGQQVEESRQRGRERFHVTPPLVPSEKGHER
jgi:hypothetical protein